MSNVRNWYIYLTTAISLNSFLWALISMLRNLVTAGSIRSDRDSLAFQIAILIISLPLFLIHWNWAQRLSTESKEEQRSPLRQFYLYATLAATLAPILANLFTFFAHGLDTFSDSFIFLGVTIIPLSAIFYYHQTVITSDSANASASGLNASIRRLYIFGFSSAGLWMLIQAASNLFYWLFLELSESSSKITRLFRDGLTPEITRLLIGLTIWLVFWNWAQSAFKSSNSDEQRSTIRKAYLYLIAFISSLSAVWAASSIFAGYLRRILDVATGGPAEGPELGYAIIITMAAIWAYHSSVIRLDAAAEPDQASQSSVRRIYIYLVAGVGLGALLIGLLGISMALIDLTTSTVTFGDGLKRQVAWSTASIIAGLPVWLLPWRKAQLEIQESLTRAVTARRSTTRRIYLYFYLFMAVMSVLGGLITIVYQILLLVLGERTNAGMLNDMAQALSFAVIGLSVLGYHGSILRSDNRQEAFEQNKLMRDFNVVLLSKGDGTFAAAMQQAISAEFPHISLTSVGLTKPAAEALGTTLDLKSAKKSIAAAELIIGPWDIALDEGESSDITAALNSSPATKLLAPTQTTGWNLAGVDEWSDEELIEQMIHSIKQILEGENVKMARSIGLGAIAVLVVGGLCMLSIVFSLVGRLLF